MTHADLIFVAFIIALLGVLASPFVGIGLVVCLFLRSSRVASALGLASGAVAAFAAYRATADMPTWNPAGVMQWSGSSRAVLFAIGAFAIVAGLVFLVARIVAEKNERVPAPRRQPPPASRG